MEVAPKEIKAKKPKTVQVYQPKKVVPEYKTEESKSEEQSQSVPVPSVQNSSDDSSQIEALKR